MSLFSLCKRKYLDGKEKMVIKPLLKFFVCHQVQMRLSTAQNFSQGFCFIQGKPRTSP